MQHRYKNNTGDNHCRLSPVCVWGCRRELVVHCQEQLLVAAGFLHTVLDKLHCLDRSAVREEPAENPHAVDGVLAEEQVVASSARRDDVDGREDAFVRQLAVELQLHVSGALELFENHLVHLRTGLDKCGCDDCERSAVFNVSCGAEEAFWLLQRVGVDTAGEDFARCWRHGVVGACQTCD